MTKRTGPHWGSPTALAPGLTPQALKNARWWRWETTAAAATATHERVARDALSRVHRKYASDAKPRPAPLPRLLDPVYAARERLWFVERARSLALRHYLDLLKRGGRPRQLATTVTPFRWLVAEDSFDADTLVQRVADLQKQLQRWARRLPPGSFAVGAIDVALNVDEQHGLRHWSFHAHMLVIVDAPSVVAGKAIIRRAFPLKAKAELGITRPVYSKRTRLELGSARGWLRYASKSMQIRGPHRRVVGYDADTQIRYTARKQELTKAERSQWALLAAKLKPDDLMVWVGWRRHGNFLRSTHRGTRR